MKKILIALMLLLSVSFVFAEPPESNMTVTSMARDASNGNIISLFCIMYQSHDGAFTTCTNNGTIRQSLHNETFNFTASAQGFVSANTTALITTNQTIDFYLFPIAPIQQEVNFSNSMIAWLVFFLLIIAAIILYQKIPAFSIIAGFYGVFMGLQASSQISFWFGFLLLGFSAIFIIIGADGLLK